MQVTIERHQSCKRKLSLEILIALSYNKSWFTWQGKQFETDLTKRDLFLSYVNLAGSGRAINMVSADIEALKASVIKECLYGRLGRRHQWHA